MVIYVHLFGHYQVEITSILPSSGLLTRRMESNTPSNNPEDGRIHFNRGGA